MILEGTGEDKLNHCVQHIEDQISCCRTEGKLNAEQRQQSVAIAERSGDQHQQIVPPEAEIQLQEVPTVAPHQKPAVEQGCPGTVLGELQQTVGRHPEQIQDGDIEIRPYSLGDKNGCGYCPYRSVCGFDEKVPGYEYNELEKLDNQTALDKMREEADAWE